jgi:hypothetical protein
LRSGGAGQTPDVVAPKTLVPSGETRDIHRAGGRYVTLVGSNSWFHLPQDRWPHAVDIDAVTRVATAAAALVVEAYTLTGLDWSDLRGYGLLRQPARR